METLEELLEQNRYNEFISAFDALHDNDKVADVSLYSYAGFLYLSNSVKPANLNRGILYTEIAAKNNDPTALSNVAQFYMKQIGHSYDEKKFFLYNDLARLNGDMDAIIYLGYCYLDGFGTDIDYKKAIECFENCLKNKYYGYQQAEIILRGFQIDDLEENHFDAPIERLLKRGHDGDKSVYFKLAELFFSGNVIGVITGSYASVEKVGSQYFCRGNIPKDCIRGEMWFYRAIANDNADKKGEIDRLVSLYKQNTIFGND